MKIISLKKSIRKIKADCQIIITDKIKKVADKKDLEFLHFKAKNYNLVYLPSKHKIYVGINSKSRNNIRIAIAIVMDKLKTLDYESVKITFNSKKGLSSLVEGIILGSYQFNKYKSLRRDIKLKYFYISSSIQNKEALNIINKYTIIAESTNFAKDIINLAPNDMTPKKFAKLALKEAKEIKYLTCKVFDENYLKKNNMNAFFAVSKASINPPRLIHLTYKPKKRQKILLLVGKGVTYDSGGLSLKSSKDMLTMKLDKSGGATIFAIIRAISLLELPIEIHAIIGAAENMIGGNAYKSDDIVIAKNGITIEIRNTDAEGRLILADCLCYAQKIKTDYIIDIATLSSFVGLTFGEYTFSIMGHNNKITQSFFKSSIKSGESVFILPFNIDLKHKLCSNIADITNFHSCNFGRPITAGLFLDYFIKKKNKKKWLHIDIASPTYLEKKWSYNREFGATGVSVRSCIEWILTIC